MASWPRPPRRTTSPPRSAGCSTRATPCANPPPPGTPRTRAACRWPTRSSASPPPTVMRRDGRVGDRGDAERRPAARRLPLRPADRARPARRRAARSRQQHARHRGRRRAGALPGPERRLRRGRRGRPRGGRGGLDPARQRRRRARAGRRGGAARRGRRRARGRVGLRPGPLPRAPRHRQHRRARHRSPRDRVRPPRGHPRRGGRPGRGGLRGVGVRRALPPGDARRDRRLRRELLRVRRGRRRGVARAHGGLDRALRPRQRGLPPRLGDGGRGLPRQVLPRRPQPDAAAGQARAGRTARPLGLGDGALRPGLRDVRRGQRPHARAAARPARGPARVASLPARGRRRPPPRRARPADRPAGGVAPALGLSGGGAVSLVLSPAPLGAEVAGPAIRATELARAIGAEVAFSHPHAPGDLGERAAAAGVVVAHPPWPLSARALRRSGARLIYDLYDPEPLEALQFLAGRRSGVRRTVTAMSLDRLLVALHDGHAFLCASERQRDLWTGTLLAQRLISPAVHDEDPSLGGLLAVVPFGVPDEPPAPGPGPRKRFGLDPEDEVVLWNGGLWEWLDAESVLHAVARLSPERPRLRLVFMGTSGAAQARDAEARARDLGLLGRVVRFNDGWVPYAERGAWLLQADCAVAAHHDHLETRFAHRTRLLDCLWAGLPVVCTRGDELAERIERDGL